MIWQLHIGLVIGRTSDSAMMHDDWRKKWCQLVAMRTAHVIGLDPVPSWRLEVYCDIWWYINHGNRHIHLSHDILETLVCLNYTPLCCRTWQKPRQFVLLTWPCPVQQHLALMRKRLIYQKCLSSSSFVRDNFGSPAPCMLGFVGEITISASKVGSRECHRTFAQAFPYPLD